MIERYGADTARFYVMQANPPTDTVLWSDESVDGSFRFLRRLWTMVHEHVSAGVVARYSSGELDSTLKELRFKLESGTGTLFADSCCGSEAFTRSFRQFMEQLWTGRRMTVDMLVDVGARRSAAFVLAAAAERAYALARDARKALYGFALPLPKRKNLAVTRT
jgi:leucyl-tRNA synthetase